jgi:hypothetical protein
MAIGLSIRFMGGNQEQYDAIHSHMNIDGDPPAGLIFHAAGPIREGWGILDFWESRADFDRFAESRLGPATEALAGTTFDGPPDIREFPVHHVTKP